MMFLVISMASSRRSFDSAVHYQYAAGQTSINRRYVEQRRDEAPARTQ
jgi:hypothetical protein